MKATPSPGSHPAVFDCGASQEPSKDGRFSPAGAKSVPLDRRAREQRLDLEDELTRLEHDAREPAAKEGDDGV